jgi:pimeloyl-ACP methyl ester carboxylesterase
MARVSVDGVALNCVQSGDGRDIVLVHGLAANLAFWHVWVVPFLRARYRVTTYDLRGHGYSDMPPSGYKTADLARELQALLDALRIGCAHVVGHSYGGAVALHLAAVAPERVSTLTLADARVPTLQRLPRRGEKRYWERWNEEARRHGAPIPDDLARAAYGRLDGARDRQVARGQRDVGLPAWQPGSRSAAKWRALLETTSAMDDFADPAGLTVSAIRGVRVPVLSIYGEHSHCLPTARRLARLLACPTVLVPGAGHLHPVARPRAFCDQLGRFVDDHGVERGRHPASPPARPRRPI